MDNARVMATGNTFDGSESVCSFLGEGECVERGEGIGRSGIECNTDLREREQ